MKVLIINSVWDYGSTGKLCAAQARQLEQQGHIVKVAVGRSSPGARLPENCIRIGSDWDVRLHGLTTRLLDNHGFGSRGATKAFLAWAQDYAPDLVWLHNLHGYYLHIGLLFEWIKSRPQMQVKWTLHDCWAFTGHCPHFTAVGCDKWRDGCGRCPQRRRYPASYLWDNTRKNHLRKQSAFTGVKNLTLLTPSNWLADLVKQSFLGEYRIAVHPNEIDRTVFHPTQSTFRQENQLEDKRIVLGVANVWDEQKGLEDFLALARMLDDKWKIVLVGLSERQRKHLPKNILALGRTADQTELAKLYTAADFYINASREETFGMTTAEALACGTNTIVYAGTAGEELVHQYGGTAVSGGIQGLYAYLQTQSAGKAPLPSGTR